MNRETGSVAAALLLTVLAHFGLPLSQTDPLRTTLVLLPLIISALLGVGRWVQDKGGLPTPAAVARGELAILVLLCGITLARPHLGLGPFEWTDRSLAGGFALLLMHRVSWLVIGLRRSLEREWPRLAPAPFFALPLIVYLAILPWTTNQRPPDGDAPHYLLLTHSLAYDLDTDLANNYEQGDSLRFMGWRLEPQLGDPVGAGGELYSRHNVLLPLVLAPFYRLAGLVGVLTVMAALTAATSWLTLTLARFYDSDSSPAAVLAWAALAFTAPFLLFSYQVWVEMPAALLVVVALIQIHHARRERPASAWRWLLLFGSLLLLPLLKIRFLLMSLPLASLALWQGTRRSRFTGTVLIMLLVILTGGILLFNQLVFQNPLKYHDIDGLLSYTQPPGQYVRGAAGLLFDCAFGLFANAPIWMLLIPALVVMVRSRHPALIDFGIVFLPYLMILSPRGEWFGGWSPPFRYGVTMLPLLSLWLVPLLRQPRRTASDRVIALLVLITLIATLMWLAVPGWTFNLAHGRNHLLDQLSTNLGADVARFFPSFTRVRAASYLWPIAAFVVMSWPWMGWRRTRSGNPGTWAAVLALLMSSLLVWASQHRATRMIEFEDPWLGQDRGSVHPDLWVVYRPRYRGGWSLPHEASIPLPMIARGERFDLDIDLLLMPESGRAGSLEVIDHRGRVLARSQSERFGDWISMRFEDLPWREGETMALRFDGSRNRRPRRSYAILDRARVTWR